MRAWKLLASSLALIAIAGPAFGQSDAPVPDDSAPQDSAPQNTGLWINGLPLCADTVQAAGEGTDDQGDTNTLEIRLTDEAGSYLAELTRESVGKSLSVWLDGEILMQPVIQEPILGGMLTIASSDSAQLKRAEAAALDECPSDTDGESRDPVDGDSDPAVTT